MKPDIGSHQGRRYDEFSDASMWPPLIVGAAMIALSILAVLL